jgi:hypothetical protein
MSQAPAVWCPACGAEYTIGSRYCNECRVELVVEPPPTTDGDGPRTDGDEDDADATDLVEIGNFPRLHAQILRRRLETAGLSVMAEWAADQTGAPRGVLLVPDSDADFAMAVVNEIEVDDEVPDSSPEAYIARIEEHLSVVGALLDELRTRLDHPGGAS